MESTSATRPSLLDCRTCRSRPRPTSTPTSVVVPPTSTTKTAAASQSRSRTPAPRIEFTGPLAMHWTGRSRAPAPGTTVPSLVVRRVRQAGVGHGGLDRADGQRRAGPQARVERRGVLALEEADAAPDGLAGRRHADAAEPPAAQGPLQPRARVHLLVDPQRRVLTMISAGLLGASIVRTLSATFTRIRRGACGGAHRTSKAKGRDALEGGGGGGPPLPQGPQPMPSHCPPDAKCRP